MPNLAPGGPQATPSSTPTSPTPATTDTIAEPGASALPEKLFRRLLDQAQRGDTQALQTLCETARHHESTWALAGNMAAQVEESLLGSFIPKEQLFVREAQRRKLQALRRELEGPQPTVLETLLADRVVLSWFYLHAIEANDVQSTTPMTLAQAMFRQRRLTLAQSRYLAAIRTLAQVKRLQLPAVQINVAEQQVNLAAITP